MCNIFKAHEIYKYLFEMKESNGLQKRILLKDTAACGSGKIRFFRKSHNNNK